MKIDSLKQSVMKACLCIMVLAGASCTGSAKAAVDIDTVDRHMVTGLEALATRSGSHYGNLLHNYTTQRDQLKRFLRQFLNKGLNGSTTAFLHHLTARLNKFHATVIKPMESDSNTQQLHSEIHALYKDFLQFKDLLEKNKNSKSAYIVGPQFLKFKHLVFGDIQAEYSPRNVLDGLGHRLMQTGSNIGMDADMPHFDFQIQSMIAA